MSRRPFARYFDQAPADEAGFLPLTALMAMQRRRRGPMLPGRRGRISGEMFGHPVVGFDEDIGADDEESEIAAFDDEVGAIEAEEGISGRSKLDKLQKKLDKLQAKRQKAVRKAQTGLFKRRWEARVEKLDDKIADVRSDITQEKARVARLESGPGGGTTQETPMNTDGQGRQYPRPSHRVESVPEQGYQTSIPLLAASGQDSFAAAFAAGAAANSTVNIQGSTGLVPYAAFRVIGIEAICWLNPAYRVDGSSIPTIVDYTSQAKLTLQTLQVDGGINLLYGNTTQSFANPLAGSGPQRQTIRGLRQHDILDRNSIVQLVGFVENPFATTATTGAFSAAFSFNLLLEVMYDSKVR